MAEQDLENLRAAHRDWNIRLTGTECRIPIATRLDKDDLSAEELRAGLVMTLMREDWPAMAEGLAEQAEINAKLAKS